MNCPYCHNKELLSRGKDILGEILEHLKKRKNFLEGVVICGGEPTIHRDLPEVISTIKKLDYRVKLDTNGNNPELIELLVKERLIDYIAMDIKAVPEKYFSMTGVTYENIEKSVEIVRGFGDYEFRTTVYPLITLEELDRICIAHQNDNYYLQQYRPNSEKDLVPYANSVLRKFKEKYGIKARGI